MLRCHLANVAMPCSECCHAVQRMLRCCAASAAMLCSECCDAACAANAMQQMMRYHATPHHDLDIHITTPHSSCCVVGSATTVTHIPEQRHLSMPSFIERLTHEHMHKRQRPKPHPLADQETTRPDRQARHQTSTRTHDPTRAIVRMRIRTLHSDSESKGKNR